MSDVMDMSKLSRTIVYAKVYDATLNEWYQFRTPFDEGYISTSPDPYILPLEPRNGTPQRKKRRDEFMRAFMATGVLPF
jgi:hypothetical protein